MAGEASQLPVDSSVLFVGGLPSSGVTADTLAEALRPHGDVAAAHLPLRSASSSKNRGFGYVIFNGADSAPEIARRLPEVTVAGSRVDLRVADGFRPGVTITHRSNRSRRRAKVLCPGVVRLENFLSLERQRQVAAICLELGSDAEGGFHVPVFEDGRQMHLEMMCLGKWWSPEARKYTAHVCRSSIPAGHSQPSSGVRPIPQELLGIATRAADAAADALGASWPELPGPSFDICILNRYSRQSRLGLHRDCDESPDSIKAGAPVVSLSIGAACEFEYVSPECDITAKANAQQTHQPKVVRLSSGDALVFGGPARLMQHGVRRLLPGRSPVSELQTESGPVRLNLTFRKF